ncbi:MAG: glycerol acyltransferase [Rikenellaceae bacterium]
MNVDIAKIVKNKNFKLYKKIPSFLFKLMARIIHQKEINEILTNFSTLKDAEFITATLDHLSITRDINFDRLEEKKEGDNSLIFVANHPLGGVDGFVLAEAIAARYGDVKVVVNDILMNIEPVKGLFVPINKHGKQSSDYASLLNDTFESKTPILYFPAGLCSRKINGRVTDLKWHNSFLKKAISHNRDVVPVMVDSLNSIFFYNFALLRKRLNIVANLEMVLLPSELFKKRGKKIKIIFGEKIEIETLKNDKSVATKVEEIRQKCYSLKI